jgi:PAS domain S-box-containing protein
VTRLERFERTLSELPGLLAMTRTRMPSVISDVRETEMWVAMKDTAWIRSYVGAPIIVQGNVIGFINVDSDTPNTFTAYQAHQLQAFANHVGVAIRNARLFRQLTRAADDNERRVQERTEALSREKAQLQAILDSIGEGVVYYDERNKPIYINRALEELFGYEESAWLSGDAAINVTGITVEERDALAVHVDQILRHAGVWEQDINAVRADGSELDAKIIVRPVIAADGTPKGAVSVYRDTSQEKALLERQARFVSYASHELRTPLTNLKTRLYLIRRKPEERERHLDVMDEVVTHMENIVEGLLSIAKLRNRNMPVVYDEFDLADVVREVHRAQEAEAERMGLRLQLSLPGAVPVVGDRTRMLQVLTNLTTNALMHTSAGGEVSLELVVGGQPLSDGITLSNPLALQTEVASRRKRWVQVRVRDDGEGIGAEHLPHVFQPFYRVMKDLPGHGLGLAISAEIVRLHEGTIAVESVEGQGSVFTVWLPCRRDGRA